MKCAVCGELAAVGVGADSRCFTHAIERGTAERAGAVPMVKCPGCRAMVDSRKPTCPSVANCNELSWNARSQ